ncbi:MAG: 30S ribosomal protein S8 [Mollicutes bacterium PWAP]|nr:30S ribosomal protein S8 [Mollicutes bacterium PWAP]
MGIITDPISDMLIRIKNANQRKHRTVLMPYSKVKEVILNILLIEGFISDVKTTGEGIKKELSVTLKYKNNVKVITGVKRISKPSLRVYVSNSEIPQVLSGYGTAIISTSNGMITGKKAKELGVGGEVIAYVW